MATALMVSLTLLGLATGPTAEASGHVPDECLEDAAIDGGLVIDRSGSMGGERIQAAKDGAKLFLDDLNGSDQSGLVSYASSATLDKALGPNHSATRDAVEDLTAGGGTDTGEGIDLSHDDFKNNGRADAKHVMILLSDGHSSGDPVTEADQAKADGIEIYAIGVGDNIDEPELREIASDPDERYFHHATDSSDVEGVFENITNDVLRNDTEAPNVSVDRPEPGHLYVGGVDHGPNTAQFDDRASILGNMSFEAHTSENCLLEEVTFETSPDVGWNHTENATDITTSEFPGNNAPEGNYTLFVNGTDWVGLKDRAEVPFRIIEQPPPFWVDAETLCGETQRVLANDTIRFDLTAKSDNESRLVSLDVSGLPDGSLFPIPDPANPVSSTFSWSPNETQIGLHNVTFHAEDDLGKGAPDCPVTIDVRDEPIYWEQPDCGTTLPLVADETFSFDVTAASLEADRNVSLDVSGLPSGASFPIPDPNNPVTSTFAWTPDEDQIGLHDVTFHAEDDTGHQGPDCPVTLFVQIPPFWDNPEPVCGTSWTFVAGHTRSFDLAARSEHTDRSVSLDHLGLPSGASFPIPTPDNPVSSTFSWTPGTDQVGEHRIVFTAEDEAGLRAPECPVTIDVVEDAEPPYWVDADAICGETHRVLANDTLRFDLTAKSDNVSRIVSLDRVGLPSGASFPIPDPDNPVSSTFSWTPNETQIGWYDVTFLAEDDLELDAPDCPLTIEVRDDPIYWEQPVCGSTNTHRVKETIAFDVTAASIDEERNVSLNASGLPEGASFPIPDPDNPVNSTFSWTPTGQQPGTYNVTFTAEDDTGHQGPDCQVTLVVRVPPVWDNPAPVCETTPIAIVNETLTLELRARSNDTERAISLDVLGPPSGASFPLPEPDNPVNSTFSWTPDETQVGEHDLGFIAFDDLGLSAPDCPVTIQVFEHRVVWLEPTCGTRQRILVDETFTTDVAAMSPFEARTVTLDHLGLPSGASFPIPDPDNPVSSTFSWTPSEAQIGVHNVTFTAEDDVGNQAPDCTITLDVRIPPEWNNPRPVCGTTQRLFPGDSILSEVEALSLDAERNVSLNVEGLPDGASFPIPDPDNPVNSTFSWTPTHAQTGRHEIRFTATDDIGLEAPPCPLVIHVLERRGQALATGLWAGTAVPASTEHHTTPADQRGPGFEADTHLVIDQPSLNLHAEGVEETATVTFHSEDRVTASGTTRLAHVDLWDGIVSIDGLEQNASLRWDARNQTHTLDTVPRVGNLTIGGETIPVHRTDETLRFPIPGGGSLVLFETVEEPDTNGVVYKENLIHAYLPAEYGRHEVILGSLELRAGDAPPAFPYESQTRRIHEQDDAGSGRDAGEEDPVSIETGTYHGSLPTGDTLDHYAIDLEHGEKLNLAVQPAPRGATGSPELSLYSTSPVAIPSGASVSLPETLGLRLFDPTGEQREQAEITPSSVVTRRIEFNADIDGTWHATLVRIGSSPTAYNYSMAATVTPVPLLPGDQAASGDDLPGACDPDDGRIPEIRTGVWPGVFKHEDVFDVYRFRAQIGELVSVALKPGETLDGVDMALVLYDEDCQVLRRSDWGPSIPKGLPETTLELPSEYTGDYFIGVERVNGVGNYYLSLTVANPMPTLPQNDATTGQDAPSACSEASRAPPALYQGRLHDGDPGDAYELRFRENFQAFVTVEMSLTAEIDVELTTPSGGTISPTVALNEQTWVFSFETEEAGDYCLRVVPDHAGGNYMVSHGETPLLDPLRP